MCVCTCKPRELLTFAWLYTENCYVPLRKGLHYALHPVRLSFRPSVPLTRKWKTIQRSNLEKRLPTSTVTGRAILRSKGKMSRSHGQKKGRAAYRVGYWDHTYWFNSGEVYIS